MDVIVPPEEIKEMQALLNPCPSSKVIEPTPFHGNGFATISAGGTPIVNPKYYSTTVIPTVYTPTYIDTVVPPSPSYVPPTTVSVPSTVVVNVPTISNHPPTYIPPTV